MTDHNEPNADRNEPDAEQIAGSVREQIAEAGSSRRGFLGLSALAGGALLTLGGTGLSVADQHEGDGMGAAFDDVEGTDVDVLNYALSLEQFEVAFYEEALDTLDEEAFVDADALQAYDETQREELYSQIETIADHEAQHVEVLMQSVELLGGEPATPGEYEFGIEGVDDFLSLGQAIENTGVAAYAGAAPFVESPDLLGAALSIHSVEARHAALFDTLVGESPFPNAFDSASSQADVLDVVGQFAADDEAEDGDETEDDEMDSEETEEEGEAEPEEEGEAEPEEEGEAEPEEEGEAEPEEEGEAEPEDETETASDGTETAGGNETAPNGTAGNETTVPSGNETTVPNGNETTVSNGTAGNETATPNGG